MRVISEESLKALKHAWKSPRANYWIDEILEECQELQEPWVTLDEFLQSGFEGLCWIEGVNGKLKHCLYRNNIFYDEHHKLPIRYDAITHVMPIHKPEPPR